MIKNILFDCERMKHPHTGLYHFCLHLGNALLRNINSLKENITFYAPEKAEKPFGKNAVYVSQSSFHKYKFPSVNFFDIWHCTYQDSHYKPRSNIKQVLTIHDLNFLYEHKVRIGKVKKSLRRIQNHINNSDKICTISEYVKKDIQQHLELNNKTIEIIYNGCNIDISETLLPPAFQPGKSFLFSIGTITDKKNFHTLPALLHQNEFLLLVAGAVHKEKYLKKIINTAETLGVKDRVVFTGPVSENDKQWYLKNCEAFVFPSLAEGFGLPVIEAMAFGKPLFLSAATSLPEIGGDVAYYFNSFDASDMQNVFEKGMRHYYETNAEEVIRKRSTMFNWDTAAKQYINIYRSLY